MNKYCDFEIKPTDLYRDAKLKNFKKDYYKNLEEAKNYYFMNLYKKDDKYPCRKYNRRREVPAPFCMNCKKERCRFDLVSAKRSRFEK